MSDELSGVDLSKPPEQEEPEEQKAEETTEEPEKKEKSLGEVLQEFPGAPNDADIEKWKQEFGEVMCSMFSESELFIFRPINREEWVNLQMHIADAQQKGTPVSNFDVEDKVVKNCVLWSSPPAVDSLANKAGSLSTLHEQILQHSNFVNPQYASQYVVKL
jgi:hypothetical protein